MSAVSPEQIALILGIQPPPGTLAELDARVSAGLPKAALRSSIDHILSVPAERTELLRAIIPAATYKRRRERLSPEESGRAERLARVIATAQHIWQSDDDARQFLTSPHTLLDGQTPLAVSLTEIGARRVEDLLWQIFYGLPA